MSNIDTIHRFYTAFSEGNAGNMAECYHTEIVFTDPAFGELQGEAAKKMWQMLIERSKGNIKITFSGVRANDKTGSANWVAEYKFGATQRKVINKITAEFEFKDGKIIRHTDRFNLWKWSSQALGWKGMLLGWTPFMKNKIQHQSRKLLKEYMGR